MFVFIEFFIRRTFIIYFKDKIKIKTKELDRFPYLGLKKLHSFNKHQKKFNEVVELSLSQSKIYLNDDAIKNCSQILKNLDLEEKKILCLHVRDSNYKNDGYKRNYRNSDINNYRELINFYIKNDFTVIRLGQKTVIKLILITQNLLIIL